MADLEERRLVEQVEQLAQDRIDRNRRIQELTQTISDLTRALEQIAEYDLAGNKFDDFAIKIARAALSSARSEEKK